MEDGILDNLPNIERNILNDGIIEQGTLGSHFTHVRCWNEMRCDEVMPDLVISRKRGVYICTPMCASARVASSNIMISEYRSHGELGY